MTSPNPSISIIIPAYNCKEFITTAIESVENQTFQDFEIIVVDDGSSDGTEEILQSLTNRVRVLRQDNKGSAAARNYGASVAKGEWLAFLDADDIWHPKKLEKQINRLEGRDWSYTDTQFLGGPNSGRRDSDFTKKHQGNVFIEIIQGNFINTSTVLLKSKIFHELEGFDTSLRSIQDWELWSRIGEKYEITYVDEALCEYRVHSKSTSRSTRKTFPNHLNVINKIFSRLDGSRAISKQKNLAIAKSGGICSYIAEEEGDLTFALYCAYKSAMHDPLNISRWKRLTKVIVKWALRPKR